MPSESDDAEPSNDARQVRHRRGERRRRRPRSAGGRGAQVVVLGNLRRRQDRRVDRDVVDVAGEAVGAGPRAVPADPPVAAVVLPGGARRCASRPGRRRPSGPARRTRGSATTWCHAPSL